MKTENLRIALEHYESLVSMLDSSEALEGLNIAKQSQQELSEVTKLVDVVKGFIDDNEFVEEFDVHNSAYASPGEFSGLVIKLCDIVGYKD